jgi:TetR/AcrR family transcriptional repressor of nem operon
MARPREFDEAKAVAGAMDVFWRLGYEGASLPALLDGMKLTRGSLYKAFTDKKTLFLIALKRYEADAVVPAVAILSDRSMADGAVRIRTLFQSILDAVSQGDRRGCLLCSAAAGPAAHDEDIARDVQNLIRQMHDGFATALAASPAHDGIGPAARDEMAALLVTQYTGLRILTRSHTPLPVLERGVRALSSLLSPN